MNWRKSVKSRAETNIESFTHDLKELMDSYEIKQANDFIVKHTIYDDEIKDGSLEYTFILKKS